MPEWISWLALFVFLYPGAMAVYWTVFGTFYYFFWERGRPEPKFRAKDAPKVSVLVPCYNEAANLRKSVPFLVTLNYPNYELVLINDGSRDNTRRVINELAAQHPHKIRAIHQPNGGKASALNNALQKIDSEYVVCIDGDAVLDRKAVDYMMQTLLSDPMIGGVTGNPRVRNRSTILGQMQVAEFSSIIGLIKRAQCILGTVFTVSGVICGFRRSVLLQVGGWSTNMITEDIDISWKVQLAGYNIAYEPRALCWVLMPESFRGLFKQRLRWAQGGAEVIMKYARYVWRWDYRRLWPLYAEYMVTAFWAYSLIAILVAKIVFYDTPMITWNNADDFLPAQSALLFLFFLVQFMLSVWIDSRYEKGVGRYFVNSVWYPYVFWAMSVATLVMGIPKALLRDRKRQATWVSPDRGV
ncbi:poly-beta-1,6-N-acetyl-D-glucosamine synthase [Neisseria shayeganii]|uniref:Poly-beta-1,6-N-acetyl-D-glucosamine synthase n=1 Tax=Neisseria shayeganii 871 TaxID=1032488 RepID=G4CKN3_9NEIS|nr:poly-beta-1,6-N-acetyl-D-glucosamine synthase [Neisseria shayeganii]EGY51566.1 biofilm PGA synthesis N-glycosyltransferase PgaC [Neisseria shayeganii 871]